jgi:hypothetical protein
MSYGNGLVDILLVEYIDHILREPAPNIKLGVGRLVSPTISKEIGSNNSVALWLEKGDLFTPEVGGSREPMREEEGGFASGWG